MMNKHLTTLFWILTDALIIFAIPFFPSVFSIFCIISAIVFVPIDIWQDFLNKYLKKPIKSIIIALGIAFVIALFPLSEIVTSFYKLANPQLISPPNTSSVVYYEEHSSDFSISSNTQDTHSQLTTTSNITSTSSEKEKSSTSSKISTSSKPAQSNNTSKEISNSDSVYRTPSGKRYHNSPTCGGKNSYEVAYDDAINDGLTPCQRCAK